MIYSGNSIDLSINCTPLGFRVEKLAPSRKQNIEAKRKNGNLTYFEFGSSMLLKCWDNFFCFSIFVQKIELQSSPVKNTERMNWKCSDGEVSLNAILLNVAYSTFATWTFGVPVLLLDRTVLLNRNSWNIPLKCNFLLIFA